MNETKNYGVIEGKRESDWIAGTLLYEVKNPSGDWTAFLPSGEWQKNSFIDTMACVTFSALNSIEAQYKFLAEQDRNFSDRYTAFMSGTTSNGNYLWKVADSIRKDGIVDETIWPAPESFTWETYYSPPNIEVINQAKRFLEEWQVNYEFVDFAKESLIYHLKQAPLQVVIPGHAVLGFYRNEDVLKYFDSYEPFFKERTESVSSVLKLVLKKKNMVLTEKDVVFLQSLEGFSDPAGVAYWTGKTLAEYRAARIPDKIKELEKAK